MKTAPSLSLNQVKVEFDAWRASRTGRARIPEHLWAAAIELLNYYPICKVKKQLNLNLKQLKQRRSANRQFNQHSLPKQQFLEIKAGAIAANNAVPKPSLSHNQINSTQLIESICRIAFERSDGSRLTISLPADSNIIPAICANLMRA